MMGSVQWADGSIYEGGLVDGGFNGAGKITLAQGRGECTLEFKPAVQDNFTYYGVLMYPDGSKYEGNIVEKKPDGYGTFNSATDGTTFTGWFRRGRKIGIGKIKVGSEEYHVNADNGLRVDEYYWGNLRKLMSRI